MPDSSILNPMYAGWEFEGVAEDPEGEPQDAEVHHHQATEIKVLEDEDL